MGLLLGPKNIVITLNYISFMYHKSSEFQFKNVTILVSKYQDSTIIDSEIPIYNNFLLRHTNYITPFKIVCVLIHYLYIVEHPPPAVWR